MAIEPQDGQSHHLLGVVLLANGLPMQALSAFDRVSALDPHRQQSRLRRCSAFTTASGATRGLLVRLKRINHESRRCDTEGRQGGCRLERGKRREIALKYRTSVGSGASFGPTPCRSVRRQGFDDLKILDGIAENGVNSVYTYPRWTRRAYSPPCIGSHTFGFGSKRSLPACGCRGALAARNSLANLGPWNGDGTDGISYGHRTRTLGPGAPWLRATSSASPGTPWRGVNTLRPRASCPGPSPPSPETSRSSSLRRKLRYTAVTPMQPWHTCEPPSAWIPTTWPAVPG